MLLLIGSMSVILLLILCLVVIVFLTIMFLKEESKSNLSKIYLFLRLFILWFIAYKILLFLGQLI